MIALDPSVLTFNGTRFSSVELEGEFWLRPDELGRCMALESPEDTLLGLYETHAHQFSERLTAFAGVETPAGPRLMRVFNPLGAYVLCTFVDTPAALPLRRWLLETLVFLQIDVKREIRRMNEELRALRADVEALEEALRRKDTDQAAPDPKDLETEFRRIFEEHTALLRAVAEDVRNLRAARAGWSRDALDAEFRRVLEERTGLLLGLAEDVKAMRGSWAGGPARFQGFLDRAAEQLRDLLDDPAARTLGGELPGLAQAVADLRLRLETLVPARRDVAQAARAARNEAGVAVPTLPEYQSLGFLYQDELLRGLVLRDDPKAWIIAEDLGRLMGLPEARLARVGAEVERLVPEAHRKFLDDNPNLPLVDPAGIDALLFRWGNPLDEGQAELWTWLAGTVIPALHATMLKQVQVQPEGQAHPGFPGNPTEVVADEPGLFKVWAGELDGHPCRLINARDLYKHLNAGWKPFPQWFREHAEPAGWRDGRDYRPVYVKVGQYDPYLSLDAALRLLALEKNPKKAEAQAYLQKVALGQPATLVGEATVVREACTAVTVTHCFDKKWTIRTVMNAHGEIWWIAKDVCDALEYADAAQAVKQHCKRAKSLNQIASVNLTEGNEEALPGNTKCICEADLYRLAIKSTKPEAERFEIWVMEEVLPTLARTGRYEMPGAPATAVPVGILPDTPPRRPLVFPCTDAKGHVIHLRVAIRDGRAEAVVFDLGNALGEKEHEFLKWYAGIPARYHGSVPSESGETVLATLSAEGLAYLFGQRAHRPEVDAFRAFWFGAVEPALAARRAGAPVQASSKSGPAAEAAGNAPEAAGESDASLRARFGALAQWLWKHRDGRTSHVVLSNSAALLARLWTLAEGEWLTLGVKKTFARSVGLSTGTSAEQGLAHLCRWGLVEARPAEAAWPEAIRVDRERVETALREAGLKKVA